MRGPPGPGYVRGKIEHFGSGSLWERGRLALSRREFMAGVPPAPASSERTSPWRPLDISTALRTPDSFGVGLVAHNRKEPLLVTHGVIRSEVSRILYDPLARANGAAYFQYIVTQLDEEARRLADKMFRQSAVEGGPRLQWREFGRT